MIKLKGITFKNFKVFGSTPYRINFEDNQLILMDGPNGYGKTSVFDAIELALTGNISRLIALENRQNPTDIVVAHEGAQEVEVILEFKDDNSKEYAILRKLKDPIPRDARKISKFQELWQSYEMIDGQWQAVDSTQLGNYLNSNNFSRDFSLFHYIQQEETAIFLKSKNEAQRAEELSQLFGDTKKAEDKLSHLNSIQKKIDALKKGTWQKISQIKSTYNISNIADLTNTSKSLHFFLLPHLVEKHSTPEWDKADLGILSQEKLSHFLEEVSHIKSFINHKTDYLRLRSYSRASQRIEPIRYFIQSFNFLSKITDLHELGARNSFLRQALSTLTSGNLQRIKDIPTIEELFRVLQSAPPLEFNEKLDELLLEEQKSSGLDKLYSDIIKHHNNLSGALSALPDEKNCLFCGHPYETHNLLTAAVSDHENLIKTLLNDQATLLVTMRDYFYKNHLAPLIEKIKSLLEKTPSPSENDLNNLARARDNQDTLQKLHAWLLRENIEFEDLLTVDLPSLRTDADIQHAVGELSERIRNASGAPAENYHDANSGNVFDRIFRDYFSSDPKHISSEIADWADQKTQYIQENYFNSLQNIAMELTALDKKFLTLKQSGEELTEIMSTLRTQIRQYRKKLITDIEIPFYIYSGKILQAHQAGLGLGVLIKDPTGGDELKNVRLVSNWRSDHDILNTMSSGQISAVVISLALALNKVYAKSFSTILIDDPVQTMDDINMSSLVELLRNEFSEKQIILSTHEEKVSRYFVYKFLKHGHSVKKVNLMERKEYTPNNNYIY